MDQAQSERFRTIDRIRRETADAYAAAAASLREVETAGRRVAAAQRAFKEDLTRARNLEAWPIEVLNSLLLLNSARQDLIHALVGYDEAEFQLFVALGRPPTLAPYSEQGCPPGSPGDCGRPTSGMIENPGSRRAHRRSFVSHGLSAVLMSSNTADTAVAHERPTLSTGTHPCNQSPVILDPFPSRLL